jgi:hypothetical protein
MRSPFLLCAILSPGLAFGYSVLTHEAIIDSAWEDSIKPLLLHRFPTASPEELIKAHGYAYGGAIIQDAGYYPHGSHLFSDLAHYIRSGDFIINLINESTDLNEYAFALGALAHYAADEKGHPIAVNPSVPMLYPKLGRKFGPVMTYQDNPVAHVKTEFAFDVLQVARGYYAPEAYHAFIGFGVSKPVLERAFEKTYCLRLDDVFTNVDHGLNTYRHTASVVIPEATKVAWILKKREIVNHSPGIVRRKFIYNVSRASYQKEWGCDYERPGFGARILAFFLRLLPRIGPLKFLGFKTPNAKAEDLFMKSFDATLDEYRSFLKRAGNGTLALPDMNFDTGQPARPGTYRLADETQAKWRQKLTEKHVDCQSPPAVLILK